ncbi:MAG TPA: S41 family peptidase [Phycisphaerales bacterium]|nr:S41 family peptidase [Phycisphaerales bacterium]
MLKACVLAVASVLGALPTTVLAQPQPRPDAQPQAAAGVQGYYRQPAIHGELIVFVSEGDLWKVPLRGGVASRMTTHAGAEGSPRISPDGTQVAFVGTYEGPTEVYVMPVSGGVPKRLTFDSERAAAVGWHGDRILASTTRFSTLPATQLTLIDPRSGGRDVIPLAQASDGCFDDKGRLYFTRLAFQGSQTKRYQGGTAQNLWRWDRGDNEAVPLTADYKGTSATPMWWKGRVYFLSDRGGMMELWSMTPEGKELKRHTNHDRGATVGFDVKSPSLSEGRIVYQLGADLWAYDIAKNTDTKIAVTLDSDFDQMRESWVKNPFQYLSAAHVSPDGDRVVLTARGQVFVAPKGQGRLAEVTRKGGVRYRQARFMPDGKSLVALSDESGEVEVWTLPANGIGKPEQLTTDGTVLRWESEPSPDGKWLVHTDKNQRLWIMNLETKEQKQVDENKWDDVGGIEWSPDSRWFTYVTHASNLNRIVRLYSVETGALTPVTTDRYDSFACSWSPDGNWLYLLSDRNLKSVVGSPWGQMAPEPYFDKKTKVYQVALRKGVRSPFTPADELSAEKKDEKKEEKTKEEKPSEEKPETKDEKSDAAEKGSSSEKKGDAEKKADAEKKGKADKKPKPVKIDLDGLSNRLAEIPVPPGRYSGLSVTDKRLYFFDRDDDKANLAFLEISNKDHEVKTLAKDVTQYELTLDRKSIMLRKGNAIHIVDAAAAANVGLDDKNIVKLSGWTFPVTPREEWRQMFVEAWRLERDYFYDTKMHGLDWGAMRDRYLPLVDRISSREELSDLIAQMVGELSALHIFVRGGDVRQGSDTVTAGSLGGLLVRDEAAGGYRVERIYQCDPDMPERRSPLLAPGVDIEQGDVILEINGRPTLSVQDCALLLRNQAGKQVLLKVKPKNPRPVRAADEDTGEKADTSDKADKDSGEEKDKPDATDTADGTRLAVIVPITPQSENDLRYHDWQHSRRMMVEDMGKGDIGYIHLRAMGSENIAEFARGYYPVFNRKGLIIDVRNNRGGNIDSWILSRLLRKAWFFWQPRVGEPYWNMQYAFRGHVAVLCNESTASDGEAFAEGIKRLNIGKVIGTRTWGGEIWLSSSNFLVDGGIATAAEIGVFGPEGQWLIEGHGVDPDIVVDNLPHATFKGKDAQLEAAVKHLQQRIKDEPIPEPKAPPHPVKAWKPSEEPAR